MSQEQRYVPSSPAAAELHEDLRRLQLADHYAALVFEDSVTTVMGIGLGIVVLPLSLFSVGISKGGLSGEVITVGLRESIGRMRQAGPSALLAESLLALVRASGGVEPFPNRLDWTTDAIQMLRQLTVESRLCRAYVTLAELLKNQGLLHDALHALVLAERAEQGDTGALVAIHYYRAEILRRLRLPFEALPALDRAWDLLTRIEDGPGSGWRDSIQAERMSNLIELRHEEDALAAAEEWISSGTDSHVPFLARARARGLRGDPAASEDYLEASARAAATIASSLSGRFQRSVRAGTDRVFTSSIRAFLAAGRADLALSVLELSRSGSATLARSSGGAPDTLVESGYDDLARDTADLILAAGEAIAGGDPAAVGSCQERADWIIARREILDRRTALGTTSVDTLRTWTEMTRDALPAGTVVLTWAVTGESVDVFALSRTGLVCSPVDGPARQLALLARSVRHECQGLFPTDALEELRRRLISPVAAVLDGGSRVVIALPEMLHGIPFHAMRPLMDSHDVSYVTRMAELVEAAKRVSPRLTRESVWTGLSAPAADYAALPDLPGARDETAHIAALFATPGVRLEPAATSQDLLGLTGHHDVLHIACHGVFDAAAPLLSRLLLADRPVFAFEIMMADLDVGDVVLSACDTAQSHADLGGYVQSVAAAFLRAGADEVVGALWPVDDGTAMRFLSSFYEHRLSGTLSATVALRAAQQDVRDHGGTHPYFWAPFAHFGGAAPCDT